MKTTEKVVQYAVSKLGCRYSQSERMKENVFDCSSLVARAYQAAGYTFQTEQNTSCYLVYDPQFDLIYPDVTKALGKKLTSVEALMQNASYKPQAGDLLFFRTSARRDSFNKITHVAIVESASSMIHARSVEHGVVRTALHLYGGGVVAALRFQEAGENVRAGRCEGNGVNVRQTPGGTAIAQLDKGYPLVILGADGDAWLRVTTFLGDKVLTGFMSASYAK